MGLRVVGARTPFLNRDEAGKLLAQALRDEGWPRRIGTAHERNALVLGIPRGGVVIGSVIARELGAELDVVIARKLSAPGNPELALGAVIEGGGTYLNRGLIGGTGAEEGYIEEEKARQLQLIRRRAAAYRAVREITPREGRDLLVVDDGVATGATMLATLNGLRAAGPSSLWCAIPVGPEDTLEELTQSADEVLCLASPRFFQAVGQFYQRFEQVEDAEVLDILKRAKRAS